MHPESTPGSEAAQQPWFRWRSDSRDVDEQAEMLPAWEQTYLQLERGPFESFIDGVRLSDDLSLFRKCTNRRLHKVFVTPRDSFAVALLMEDSADVVYQHQRAMRGDLLVLPPGRALEIVTRGCFDVTVAVLGQQVVAQGLHGLCSGKGGALIRPAHESTRRLGELMHGLLSGQGPGQQTKAGSAELQRRLKVRLEYQLAECLSQPESTAFAPSTLCPAAMVHAARQLVLAEALMNGRVLPLPEWSARLGVSVRQLHKLFDAHLGMPPRAYAEQLRLSQARSDLRSAPSGTTTVAAVASRWGFWHLGRFASRYRAAFGELPSDTAMARRGSEAVREARVHDQRAEVGRGRRLGSAVGKVGGHVHLGP